MEGVDHQPKDHVTSGRDIQTIPLNEISYLIFFFMAINKVNSFIGSKLKNLREVWLKIQKNTEVVSNSRRYEKTVYFHKVEVK